MQKNEFDCSIIIPAFNASNTIGEILESIKESDRIRYEIIVVNDGSIDSTEKVVMQYQKLDLRIKLINKPNGGASSARNCGLEVSTGDWIYFLDSDDRVNVDDLEKMIVTGNNYGADIVVSDYMEADIRTGHIKKVSSRLPYDTLLNRDYIEQKIMRRYFDGDYEGLATLWNKIYRRNLVNLNKIKFDENRVHGEDWKFNICYFQIVHTAVALNTTVYTYQLDGSQTLEKYGERIGNGFLEAYDISKHLNEEYNFVEKSSIEYRLFMGRFLGRSLGFLKVESFSTLAKTAFLRSPEEQELYKYLLRMNRSDLAAIGHSRRSKIAFLMLKLGQLRIGLKILGVK